jgi:hypothetical protein
MSAHLLAWSRNIEVLNKDGTKGRGQEEMSITNEPVFFGGMNRAPSDINDAFKRRLCFRTCIQFERADGVTFEEAKEHEESTRDDPERTRWVQALRDNAKLHMLVSSAEFCGIIAAPELTIWNKLTETFKREVNRYVKVNNFSDRISDARTRLVILTRMIAIFETYQQEDSILTFDNIISMLPEVERRSMAGEQLCLTVLSGLDDVAFPLIHRIILHCIQTKWPELADTPLDDVFVRNGTSLGSYALLPMNSVRPKMKEDVTGCAKRVIFQELRSIIAGETRKYKLEVGETSMCLVSSLET